MNKIKERWEKVKTWVKEHKKAIIYGSFVVGSGLLVTAVTAIGKSMSCEETQEEISESVPVEETSDTIPDYEKYKDVDRYVLDTALVDQLPPGTYDLFDLYENERVDYVVEAKEPMET